MGFFEFIPLIGDVIEGFTDLVGTSQTNDVNLQSVRETNQAQRELAEYQWEQNIQQWKRENEYNSPEQQMQRLAAAGLNPYLVYQNGNAIMPAGNSPNYEAPNLQTYHQDAAPIQGFGKGVAQAGATMFDSYMRKEMQEAQLDKMWYDNEYTKQKTRNDFITQQLLNLEKAYRHGLITRQQIENAHLPELLISQILDNAASRERTNAEVDNLRKTGKLIEAQEQGQIAATALTQAQEREAVKMLEVHSATIRQIEQNIQTGKAQEALYLSQKLGQDINNEWNRKFGMNAPWLAKLMDGILEDPMGALQRIKSFWDIVSNGQSYEKIGLSYNTPAMIKNTIHQGLVGLNQYANRGLMTMPIMWPQLGYNWLYNKYGRKRR